MQVQVHAWVVRVQAVAALLLTVAVPPSVNPLQPLGGTLPWAVKEQARRVYSRPSPLARLRVNALV